VERAHKLGKNVAESMTKKPDEMTFLAEDQGMCPFCHSNLLLTRGENVVECPICAIRGELKLEGKKISVEWYSEDIVKIKWRPLGMGEHFQHIMERHVFFEQNKETLKPQLEKYRKYKPYSKPSRKAKEG
jgi:hypothetical protein